MLTGARGTVFQQDSGREKRRPRCSSVLRSERRRRHDLRWLGAAGGGGWSTPMSGGERERRGEVVSATQWGSGGDAGVWHDAAKPLMAVARSGGGRSSGGGRLEDHRREVQRWRRGFRAQEGSGERGKWRGRCGECFYRGGEVGPSPGEAESGRQPPAAWAASWGVGGGFGRERWGMRRTWGGGVPRPADSCAGWRRRAETAASWGGSGGHGGGWSRRKGPAPPVSEGREEGTQKRLFAREDRREAEGGEREAGLAGKEEGGSWAEPKKGGKGFNLVFLFI
uniref:Uncharacterized protein n=1 Tax=Oryza sativa subsp. japonica TaxID=39947 RepID=Q6K3N4_ORYSJ|nr:hypothetical protein [Oryza sativa Japonica Group]